ncbi:methyltransferase type 12 [Asanoa ferruginea]|nr:class I SAM-dependent methyltransferase [Asanoa ferruginea]GIF48004.1 methyltransferase type 12 [Asanoa ferruginea]
MDAEAYTRELAHRAIAEGDATAWFERLYAAAANGEAVVPWDREAPHSLLAEWAARSLTAGDERPAGSAVPGGDRSAGSAVRGGDRPAASAVAGDGRRALVVGAGLGRDAEFVAGLGFDVVAFDISETAIESARRRHPGSPVRYVAADLFDPPGEWIGAFDLVVESMTVQALPDPPRRSAIVQIGRFVARGGTLLVIAAGRDPSTVYEGPPWPLTRPEIDAFAVGDLAPTSIEELRDGDAPIFRWRAQFLRPTAVSS